MNPTDPLAQLRGLSMPEQPLFIWWPLPIGWWVVLALVVAAVYFLIKMIKHLRADNWHRQALVELQTIEQLKRSGDISEQDLLIRCSALCRRLAMAVEGREAIAGLTGAAWLAKLDELSLSEDFTNGPGAVLHNNLWKKPTEFSESTATDILSLLSKLIKNNKPSRRITGELK